MEIKGKEVIREGLLLPIGTGWAFQTEDGKVYILRKKRRDKDYESKR